MNISDMYLNLLKDSLLNEIYLENELRLLYVFAMLSTKKRIDGDVLRDVRNRLPDWFANLKKARQEGRPWWNVNVDRGDGVQVRLNLRNYCEFSHTMVGRKRLDNVQFCLDSIRAESIPGDVAETGVWRGGTSIFMKGCMKAWGMDGRKLFVADSFEGLPKPTLAQDEGYDFSAEKQPILAVSLEEVRENFRRYDLLDDSVVFLKGWFKDTLPGAPIEKLALLRLDGDLYESTMDALDALYHKVVPGGYVIVDDYGDFEPCRKAIHEFREHHAIKDEIKVIDWAGAYWRKSA